MATHDDDPLAGLDSATGRPDDVTRDDFDGNVAGHTQLPRNHPIRPRYGDELDDGVSDAAGGDQPGHSFGSPDESRPNSVDRAEEPLEVFNDTGLVGHRPGHPRHVAPGSFDNAPDDPTPSGGQVPSQPRHFTGGTGDGRASQPTRDNEWRTIFPHQRTAEEQAAWGRDIERVRQGRQGAGVIASAGGADTGDPRAPSQPRRQETPRQRGGLRARLYGAGYNLERTQGKLSLWLQAAPLGAIALAGINYAGQRYGYDIPILPPDFGGAEDLANGADGAGADVDTNESVSSTTVPSDEQPPVPPYDETPDAGGGSASTTVPGEDLLDPSDSFGPDGDSDSNESAVGTTTTTTTTPPATTPTTGQSGNDPLGAAGWPEQETTDFWRPDTQTDSEAGGVWDVGDQEDVAAVEDADDGGGVWDISDATEDQTTEDGKTEDDASAEVELSDNHSLHIEEHKGIEDGIEREMEQNGLFGEGGLYEGAGQQEQDDKAGLIREYMFKKYPEVVDALQNEGLIQGDESEYAVNNAGDLQLSEEFRNELSEFTSGKKEITQEMIDNLDTSDDRTPTTPEELAIDTDDDTLTDENSINVTGDERELPEIIQDEYGLTEDQSERLQASAEIVFEDQFDWNTENGWFEEGPDGTYFVTKEGDIFFGDDLKAYLDSLAKDPDAIPEWEAILEADNQAIEDALETLNVNFDRSINTGDSQTLSELLQDMFSEVNSDNVRSVISELDAQLGNLAGEAKGLVWENGEWRIDREALNNGRMDVTSAFKDALNWIGDSWLVQKPKEWGDSWWIDTGPGPDSIG